jgi:pimeloyl-ACP methyl ester carboxylesterase
MSKWMRRIALGAAAVVVFFGLVEVLAWSNIRRERQRRAYLGNLLYAEERGAGDPIVFIAGLQGSTRYWGSSFDALSSDHRLLFVDVYGFGRSPWPLTEPTLDDHLAWLRRTLVARHATANVTIVAHSFGTIVAASYAAKYPDDVQKLVLLGTPVFQGERDARKRIADMSQLAALFSLNTLLARESCLLMGAFRPVVRAIVPHFSRRVPDRVAEDAVLHDWPSINGAIRNILLEKPIAVALSHVRARTVFIQGTADRVAPLERIRDLARRSGGQLVLFRGDHQSYVTTGLPYVLRVLSTVSR